MIGHWGGMGIAGLAGILTTLVFLALIVLAVVLVVRALNRPRPAVSPLAQRILAERFARGEIDAEEYQARLRILNGDPTPPAEP